MYFSVAKNPKEKKKPAGRSSLARETRGSLSRGKRAEQGALGQAGEAARVVLELVLMSSLGVAGEAVRYRCGA